MWVGKCRAHGQGLQKISDGQDLHKVLDGEVGDERSLVCFPPDEPVFGKEAQSLADWSAAHAELTGKRGFVQLLPGRKPTIKDGLSNDICGLPHERSPRDPVQGIVSQPAALRREKQTIVRRIVYCQLLTLARLSGTFRRMGRRPVRRGRRSWRHLPAIAIAVTLSAPLVLMVSGSLRRAGLPPPTTPELIPSPVAWDNYERAFELVDLARYTINSFVVAAIAVPLAVLVASWAGFAMARLPRRAAGVLVSLSLIAMMVPLTALLVPRFAIFSMLGLTDTYVPLIAPALIGMSPFYVLVYYWSFKRVPAELFEAARLEGLSVTTTWRRVGMPLVRSSTVAVAILAGLFSWSNFLDPLIYLFDERLFTLPLGLKSLAQLDRHNFPLLLAGSVVATAPVLIGFLFVQRFFIQERRGWLGR